jgi:DNA protecting protein DprA
MLARMLHILTHVASQLSSRWLPPPIVPPFDELLWRRELASAPGLTELTLADWRALVVFEAVQGRGALPWLPQWLSKHDPTGDRLTRAAHGLVRDAADGGGRLVTLADDTYPMLLEVIPDPPLALTVIGRVELLKGPCESIVGSRQASALALRESFALGRRLAQAGVVVVSGGALGCDIAAHRGVLAAEREDAPAVLVFAGGLSKLYPQANARWFDELRARGAALVSERLWNAPCRPCDFRARNRIVAGLSRRTTVMQAARASGALITARLALDQGRDVAVLLHPAGDVRASGGGTLLAEGAAGIIGAEDGAFGLTATKETV